ncbi:uncharacterized protein LOC143019141 [Oratosquilla oratoria]|uniref:uncharacterized protein LOC143019141 n=1 Tax=Oratosquilla oratoria TaxID=337810 RepID=UPI003F762745
MSLALVAGDDDDSTSGRSASAANTRFFGGQGSLSPSVAGVAPGFSGAGGFGFQPTFSRPVVGGFGNGFGHQGLGGFGSFGSFGGFGGLGGLGGLGGAPSSGCRYWCRTPEGAAYCCENVNQLTNPIATQVVKPGLCPPVRPVCPRFFGPPNTCSNDGACGGVDKCCFDRCLGEHVCKPPLGFGR